MSLHPDPLGPIPEETRQVAQAAFPKGTLCLRLRDAFGSVFTDADFAALFPARGQPAEAPWRLALVTLLQYAEGLSDRQAADAVRSRIDWKYLLGLALTDQGFDASVLSEFRTRLLAGAAEQQVLDVLLRQCREHRLLATHAQQRTDSTHVLAVVRGLNRLECVAETVRAVLNQLAVLIPDWLLAHAAPAWVTRYGPRAEAYRLPRQPSERLALAEQIGRDGLSLLEAVWREPALAALRQLPSIETLRRLWVQQYLQTEAGLQWRADDNLPPASVAIRSPYDAEARAGKKRETTWEGYKVHLTETCTADQPHLITQVETTPAPLPDRAVMAQIQAALVAGKLRPQTHLVDSGYVDAATLVSSRATHGIEILGPALGDQGWQAKAGAGFARAQFPVEWEAKRVRCPQGQTSTQWSVGHDRHGREVITVGFAERLCQACPSRGQCSKRRRGGRTLTIRPQAQDEALAQARRRQTTASFAEAYAARAGVEGTLSQGVRRCGLRSSRYVGRAKTHLQHLATAAAINLVRVDEWLAGTTPATTRKSAFQTLMAPAA